MMGNTSLRVHGERCVYEILLSPAGKTITIYTGNANGVHAVVWSPKERRIASGSDDATVQIWQAI